MAYWLAHIRPYQTATEMGRPFTRNVNTKHHRQQRNNIPILQSYNSVNIFSLVSSSAKTLFLICLPTFCFLIIDSWATLIEMEYHCVLSADKCRILILFHCIFQEFHFISQKVPSKFRSLEHRLPLLGMENQLISGSQRVWTKLHEMKWQLLKCITCTIFENTQWEKAKPH